MSIRVRFAPSPTGKLHVGNVRTFLLNWLFARREGGAVMLRIDDTDLARSTAAFERGIETDLKWLGLEWDEHAKQSARFEQYDKAAEKLKTAGLLYPAYETEEELERKRRIAQSRGRPPIYDRASLQLTDAQRHAFAADGRKPHWRFKLSGARADWTDLVRGEQSIDTGSLSDPVLIREDGAYLYTLPSVVDDVDLRVTHIIRGEDHVANTGVQIELFRALGAVPPTFAHFPLLVGADGEGLSKRIGSLSVEELRESGFEPLAIASHLAKLGTSDPVSARPSLMALADEFAWEKIGRAPARFDVEELKRVNSEALHHLDYAAVKARLAARAIDHGEAFWLAVRGNLSLLSDAEIWASVVSGEIAPAVEDLAFLAEAADLLPAGPYGEDAWGAWTSAVKVKTGAKGKQLFMPLRLALTGQPHGPEMPKLFPLLSEEKVRARLAGRRA
ncbi:MAG: glutamate--tRNA ligase [Pseudomonadota bacterium]